MDERVGAPACWLNADYGGCSIRAELSADACIEIVPAGGTLTRTARIDPRHGELPTRAENVRVAVSAAR